MTLARVLVVEDDRIVARDIQMRLRRIGHEVVGSTARGEEAVELAHQTRPDLVLMDIRIEGMLDGIGAAAKIKKQYELPVVFLTAYADDETVRKASLTEPFGYLLKPFDDAQLRTVVEMAIYKHGAEQRLRESERRYATTLSSIADAVIATDRNSRITFLNPSAEVLTGCLLATAFGQGVDEVFRIRDESGFVQARMNMTDILSGDGTASFNGSTLESADGRRLRIDGHASPIIDDKGGISGSVIVFRDTTQRHSVEENLRKAREELAHVNRVNTIGELTVSIAHEMNQPLVAIAADAASCVNWLAPKRQNFERAKLAAERVVSGAHRAAEVLSTIRALAKPSRSAVTELNLNEVILEVLALLNGELRRSSVRPEAELSSDGERVTGDRVQLQQLILNLVMNAIDAMSANEAPRSLRISSVVAKSSGECVVTVSDTGKGLDRGTEDRIYETFFTTKADGLGMGLSICRSIVEMHNGKIWTSPNSPSGTNFHFSIPTS